MQTISLLWPQDTDPRRSCTPIPPQIVEDLHLEKIAQAITGHDLSRTSLLSILSSPCGDVSVIRYRQEILADFYEVPELERGFREFLPKINQLAYFTETRKGQTSPLREALWRLGELELYVECIAELSKLLSGRVRSEGLRALVRFVEEQRELPEFEKLRSELPRISRAIKKRSSVTIGINLDERLRPVEAALLSISDSRISERSLLGRLLGSDGEMKAIAPIHANPGSDLLPRAGALPLAPLLEDLDGLLKSVARPIVKAIGQFMRMSTRALASLAPEVSFYLAGLNLRRLMAEHRLPLCRPEMRPMDQRVFRTRGFYNLHMALRLGSATAGDLSNEVICNDVELTGQAGIFVLTGPNRGGKTTYTQGIGIAQVLAQTGLPVPADSAEISPVDHVVTHFPVEEKGELETGRLGEEAARLAAIFTLITRNSVVLLNESLSSTSSGESLYLAEDIIRAFRLVGCRAVFATHLHELATRADRINEEVPGDSAVVSIVAGTETPLPESNNGEARRTYRIRPGPPAGRSYARDIADRHGISYDRLVATLRDRGLVDQHGHEGPVQTPDSSG